MRLGSHTYLPAPDDAGPGKGALAKGGLLVTLEASEEILQEFVDTMSFLEKQISQRWASSETWFCGSSAE
ncbi:hypothetical protein [Streptomyces sp. NPDC013455]|uniref:hypothetical protein n=1 Tax=Streptomyces sp. NPDC013455 TaxID=3155605 RepID=UPI0033DE7C98